MKILGSGNSSTFANICCLNSTLGSKKAILAVSLQLQAQRYTLVGVLNEIFYCFQHHHQTKLGATLFFLTTQHAGKDGNTYDTGKVDGNDISVDYCKVPSRKLAAGGDDREIMFIFRRHKRCVLGKC